MIDVIFTLCPPLTTPSWFLVLESDTREVVVKVNDFGELHSVYNLVSSAEWLMAHDPITTLQPDTLVVGCASTKRAISTEGIRSKSCVLPNNV